MIQAARRPGSGLPWPKSLVCGMAAHATTDRCLAAATGISRASISRYRRGCVPNAINAERLRSFFGWSGEEVPSRVRMMNGTPVDFPDDGDRAVMRSLRAAARCIWRDVSLSRHGPGHSDRMRQHMLRIDRDRQ